VPLFHAVVITWCQFTRSPLTRRNGSADNADEMDTPVGSNMSHTILVPFEGEGSGVEDLTWGQIGLWQAMVGNGRSRTMGGITTLPADLTLDQAADGLRFSISRHQALRTRLVFDADGRARQSCSTSGEVGLDVVDAGDRDPAEVAEEVLEHHQARNFDYEHEWPVRMAVIRRDGVLTHSVVVYLHLVIDADGLAALIADLAGRDPVTGEAPPVTATPPLEQARQQRTPSAQRQCAASLRHLEHVFRTMTPTRFGEPKYDGPPAYRQIRFHSPATHLAVRAVAAHQNANTSSVLLACFAVGLARFTGNSPVMAWLMVNNRFRPGFAESVSALVQISPFLIDVADISLADAVGRARGGAMRAYKNAYYDPDLQDEVIERVNADRGAEIDHSCFYNDRRQQERDRTGDPVPTAAEILDAVPLATYAPEDEPGLPRQKMYFHVDDPDGAIDLTMSVDTRYFSPEDMVAVLRGVEAAAVRTALEPDAPTGITTPVPVHA
jgi:hypothetical protein